MSKSNPVTQGDHAKVERRGNHLKELVLQLSLSGFPVLHLTARPGKKSQCTHNGGCASAQNSLRWDTSPCVKACFHQDELCREMPRSRCRRDPPPPTICPLARRQLCGGRRLGSGLPNPGSRLQAPVAACSKPAFLSLQGSLFHISGPDRTATSGRALYSARRRRVDPRLSAQTTLPIGASRCRECSSGAASRAARRTAADRPGRCELPRYRKDSGHSTGHRYIPPGTRTENPALAGNRKDPAAQKTSRAMSIGKACSRATTGRNYQVWARAP